MSKFDRFPALFLPTLTTASVCSGIYLWRTGSGFTGYIGIVLFIVGVISVAFYAKKLRDLPEAKLINSPESDMIKQYMRGALIASFIPQAITTAIIAAHFTMPNDGVAMITFVGFYIAFLLLPFVGYPFIIFVFLEGGTSTSTYDSFYIWLILLLACLITRTVMQSMCFFATNKRIDYSNSRVGSVIMTMFGTVNIVFWFDNLWKVKQFAKIEAEGGAAAQ